jgi:guanine deaminase
MPPSDTVAAPTATAAAPPALLSDAALLRLAVDEASRGVSSGEGGPFGAVVARHGVVIARGHNRVLQTNDPTAHAEVVAIRDACARLGRWSLDDCVLYASCQPCPMCFAAAHWSKVPRCVYAASADDAAAVGFDDRYLYDALQGKTDVVKCKMEHVEVEGAMAPFHTFTKLLKSGSSSLY